MTFALCCVRLISGKNIYKEAFFSHAAKNELLTHTQVHKHLLDFVSVSINCVSFEEKSVSAWK